MIRTKLIMLVIFLHLYYSFLFGIETKERVYTERMAGFCKTVVLTNEKAPNSCVMTYFQEGAHHIDYNYLLKIIPALEIEGKIYSTNEAKNITVEDFPGGVIANFKIDDINVETTITPLLVGRETSGWEGAVLYEIKTEPSVPVVINLGGGKTITVIPNDSYNADVERNTLEPLNTPGIIDEHTLEYKSYVEDIPVLLKSSGTIEENSTGSGNQSSTTVLMPSGSGQLFIGFSNDPKRIYELGKIDYKIAREEVDEYYAELLNSSRIETPDKNMNDAFRSAIYNLEYTWLEPYGWIECLHHWPSLFQQQITPAAEWMNQLDRAKACILKQAHNLMDGGNVPQFYANGVLKRDFGGSNQYWVWQVRHYVNSTNDEEFAREIIPYLDSVIAKTTEELDKNGNMLFSWGLQIGNQEDFIAHPGDATTPTIEIVNMYRTRAELAEMVGEKDDADLWNEKADYTIQQLYDVLWLNDLGRFAYFKDLTGNIRLEGQYETYLYPLIWDIGDTRDQYTGLRHLLDRLTRNDGAVFCSNNFSWHSIGTWGMQACEAQQPWAAWGFSKFGLNNMTWLPLKVMAGWAMNQNHRGAWSEMAYSPYAFYFTPPAGLYLAATIEALFGLKMDATNNAIKISPSFPDEWPEAKLYLPEYTVDFKRDGNILIYNLETKQSLKRKISWKLPVCEIKSCTINGREVDYTLQTFVNSIELFVEIPSTKETEIVIEYEPVEYDLSYSYSIAEEDTLKINLDGIEVEEIDDRCGVISSWKCSDDAETMTAVINRNLLQSYNEYGRLGQLNFSRRTFFIRGKTTDGLSLWFPIDLTILPRFESVSVKEINLNDDNNFAQLVIRNNTNKDYSEDVTLSINEQEIKFNINVKARSEINVDVPLTKEIANTLSPGDNNAYVCIKNNGLIPVVLTANSSNETLNSSSLITLPLPEDKMIPDKDWKELRIMPGFPHIFFTFSKYGWPEPMWALEDISTISIPEIPGLTFEIPKRKMIPVSYESGKTSFVLDLKSKTYTKIYLLVLPFVDNHNIFTETARITAYSEDAIVYERVLHYPGDIDYWVPDANPTSFATFREPRPDRFGLLPLLKPEQSDWTEGKPPEFPESKYWSSSIPVETESCLMNVIELDLSKATKLDNLMFETIGDYTAFGIVGAVGVVEGKK
ncbi:MAG: hypothetical protein PVH88_00120 [Ignavibacteria bacterium]|jgi:hypothetical protein